ncbi:MAG: hypothetical protein IPM69_11325 [Ignavibacteria bacterium]|nr:hypothetical protein [Ignavibacteria bacterium]
MKTTFYVLCFFVVTVMLAHQIQAQVPRNFTVQGILTDSTSRHVHNGIHTITLRLYDKLFDGTLLFQDEFTMPVFDGYFNISLGSKTPFPPSLEFDKQYFVGISYDGNSEIARIPLASVPYSFIAESVVDGAITSRKIADGSITIDKLSPALRLDLKGESILANTFTAPNFIGGGDLNTATGTNYYNSIVAGKSNTVSAQYASVGGGFTNKVQASNGAISGGNTNTITSGGTYAFIGSGKDNTLTSSYSAIVGGYSNYGNGNYSSILGGYDNTASGDYSVILGGQGLTLNSGADKSLGFLANTGSRSMVISTPSVVVFGNTDLWLASNDGTTRALKLFSNNLDAAGAYPSTTAKNVSIKAPNSLSADYCLILPPDGGVAGQALTTNGSGVLTWEDSGGLSVAALDAEIARAQAAEEEIALALYEEQLRAQAAEEEAVLALYEEQLRAQAAEEEAVLALYEEQLRAQAAEEAVVLALYEEQLRAQAAEEAAVLALYEEQLRAQAAEEAAVLALYEEQLRAQAAEDSIVVNLIIEAVRAQTVEDSLRGNLIFEIGRAQAAEDSLLDIFNVEIVRSQETDDSLSAQLNAEIARAQAAEAAFRAELDTLESGAQATEDTLTGNLIAEIGRAQAAEDTLTINLNAEIARAQAAEDTLTVNLNAEIARAQAAEAAFRAELDTLESGAQATEDTLTGNLIAEIGRAQAAEDTLTFNLNAEIARAQAAEDTLTVNLNAEIARAQAAEAALTTAVNNEQNRAEAEEDTLTINLNAEIARAQAAEAALTTAVNNEQNRAEAEEDTLTINLNAEIARAQAAEAALTTAVNNEQNRAEAEEDTLTINLNAEIARAQAAEAAFAAEIQNATVGGDISGTISNAQIVNSAVGTVEIANDAVTTLKIDDSTIVNADISPTAAIAYSKLNLTNSIITADITAGSITTIELEDDAVTTVKIENATILDEDIDADASIAYTKLNLTQSILENDMSLGSVTTPVLGNDAVTTLKIDDSTIINADISPIAAIAYSKLELTNSIVGSDLTTASVSTVVLEDDAVTSVKIENSAILDEDIAPDADIAYSKLNLLQSILTSDLSLGSVTTPVLGNDAVTTLKIDDSTIVDADINPTAAIAYAKLNLTNSIVENDLTTNAVSTNKIGPNAITTSKIADGQVQTNDLQNGAVVALKIADGNVITSKIADNGVDGTKIALGSDAAGDIMYHNGTDYIRHPIGNNGEILSVNSGVPVWTAPSNVYTPTFLTKSADYEITAGDVTNDLMVVNTNAGSTVFTLPSAAAAGVGKKINISGSTFATNTLRVVTSGADTMFGSQIAGGSTNTFTALSSNNLLWINLVSNGDTTWYVCGLDY